MSSNYWGEMGFPSSSMSSVVDMESMSMKARSVQVKVPHLHQPSAQQKPHVHLLQTELCRPDHTSLHTIELLNHCRQVRTRVLTVQHHDSTKSEDRFGHQRLAPLPAVPQMQAPDKSSTSIPVITGIRERPGCPKLKLKDGSIEIDNGVARQLSRRAVATMCAHSGYESSQESSLETLTDVLQEFLRNTCRLLRVAVDREAVTGQTGFQDTLTQVFHEIGVGSRHNLIDFWKTQIRDYHDRIEKQTKDIRDKYEDMKNPHFQIQTQDDKSPRVKDEPLSDVSFQDPQSHHPVEEGAENQSYETSSSSDATSSHALSFQAITAMDLDESGGAAPSGSVGGTGEGVDESSTGEWYASGVKEEEDAGGEEDSNSTTLDRVKREMLSGDDTSQDLKTEDAVIGDSLVVSQIARHSLDVEVTSPPEKKIQLHMPPRKKKKK